MHAYAQYSRGTPPGSRGTTRMEAYIYAEITQRLVEWLRVMHVHGPPRGLVPCVVVLGRFSLLWTPKDQQFVR